jgi:hypothetical protein
VSRIDSVRRCRRLVPAVAAVAIAAAVLAYPAIGRDAHPAQARLELIDGNDTASPLDVREVDGTASPAALTFSASTHARWRTRALSDRAFFVVHLDPRTGRRYIAVARVTRTGVAAVLLRKRSGHDVRVAAVRAWRPDQRSVSIRIPRRRLAVPAAGAAFAWRLQTLTTTKRCPRVCIDSVPDRGDAAQTAAAVRALRASF